MVAVVAVAVVVKKKMKMKLEAKAQEQVVTSLGVDLTQVVCHVESVFEEVLRGDDDKATRMIEAFTKNIHAATKEFVGRHTDARFSDQDSRRNPTHSLLS